MHNIVFYTTFLYPNREEFFQILEVLADSGVAYVELGIPSLHPYMDGPLIRETHELVLAQHLDRETMVETLRAIKERFSFQVVLMTYQEGRERFDLDNLPDDLYAGILCVDSPEGVALPPHPVLLYPPDLTMEEVAERAKINEVFAYVVSGTGKTGSFSHLPTAYIQALPLLRQHTSLPAFVGFGIRTPADVQEVLRNGADGAIIGSEFLKHYQEGGVRAIRDYIKTFSSLN